MAEAIKTEEFIIPDEPYYQPLGREVEIFEHAHRYQIPVLLKGPTGSGKTRFMQYMAWKLKRPLITVSCHDDLTASDLVGRYLVAGGETVWMDGPLTKAVKVEDYAISMKSSRQERIPPLSFIPWQMIGECSL